MAFFKTASVFDWQAMPKDTSIHVKIASHGLLPNDAFDLRKVAGDQFAHEVKRLEGSLRKDCHYVHNIALGAFETAGQNRNGDAWNADVLARDLPTYVKHGKLFREHKNTDKDPHYGRIKFAFYDYDRGYGRTLCEYNATESAARELGGLVADKELNKLANDGYIHVSIGTHVGKDVCGICGNVATKRAEYCTPKNQGGTCDLFGCREGLCKISEDGRVQYVDNPNNVFYDLSYVEVPADRIAAGAALFDLNKKASVLVRPRLDLIAISEADTAWTTKVASVAGKLAQIEESITVPKDTDTLDKHAAVCARLGDPSASIDIKGLVHAPAIVKRACLKRLTSNRELPSASQLAKEAGYDDETAAQADLLSIGLLPKIVSSGYVVDLIKRSDFTAQPLRSVGHYLEAVTSAPGYSWDEKSLKKRAFKAAFEERRVPYVSNLLSELKPGALDSALNFTAMKIAAAVEIFDKDPNALNLIATPSC